MQNNEYITKDLGEAAALVTGHCILKNLIWKQERAYFIFENPKACKKISQQYFYEELQLPIRVFYENLRLIKRRLYSEQNKKGGETA